MKFTFTGFDEFVDLEDLRKFLIKNKEKKIEIGILISDNPKDIKYPNINKVYELFKNKYDYLADFSLHFCGSSVFSFISRINENYINIAEKANRIQLNFNYSNLLKTKKELLKDYFLYSEIKIPHIIQINEGNLEFLNFLKENIKISKRKNINFLMDSSGGNGIEITNFKIPETFDINNYKKKYIKENIYLFGFSGGLSLENIKEKAEKIKVQNKDEFWFKNDFWIDFETNIRTNNKFDLDKIQKILNLF